MDSFLNVFNNSFKAYQLFNQCAFDIVEIKFSTEQDRTKLIQAWGFQKAKDNIMVIKGPIENVEKFEQELIKK